MKMDHSLFLSLYIGVDAYAIAIDQNKLLQSKCGLVIIFVLVWWFVVFCLSDLMYTDCRLRLISSLTFIFCSFFFLRFIFRFLLEWIFLVLSLTNFIINRIETKYIYWTKQKMKNTKLLGQDLEKFWKIWQHQDIKSIGWFYFLLSIDNRVAVFSNICFFYLITVKL